MDNTVTVDKHTLELSNLDKIYWPKEKYTKGDVILYYEKIAPYILPYLKNRPLSLLRHPNGIEQQAFFHKDVGDNAPEWMKTFEIFSESANKNINYVVCNNKASLLYVANLGTIEMNPWNSTIKKVDNPDYMVIDIDPSENNTFDQVIETALAVKEVLSKAEIDGYCKTSGASGLHVYVPMGTKYDYDQAKEFAHIIASLTCDLLPDFTTLERSLAKRGKANIYIDFLQNRRGQTLACAYSLRPKPGATVSTPLEWKEVKKGLTPAQFTFINILKRIEKKGDLFAPVLNKGIDLRKALKNLGV